MLTAKSDVKETNILTKKECDVVVSMLEQAMYKNEKANFQQKLNFQSNIHFFKVTSINNVQMDIALKKIVYRNTIRLLMQLI